MKKNWHEKFLQLNFHLWNFYVHFKTVEVVFVSSIIEIENKKSNQLTWNKIFWKFCASARAEKQW